MANLRQYADRIVQLAHGAFNNYAAAADELTAAKERFESMPASTDMNGIDNSIDASKRQTAVFEAEKKLSEAEAYMREQLAYMQGDLRNMLSNDIASLYTVKAADLDDEQIKMLSLNICTASEVSAALDTYTAEHNEAMRRYIGNYARRMAANPETGEADRSIYKGIYARSSVRPEEMKLDEFDSIVQIYGMTIGNPAFMLQFDSLTEQRVKEF